MSPVFLFFRRRSRTTDRQMPPSDVLMPAVSTSTMASAPRVAASIPSLDQAIETMLAILDDYLPPPVASIPESSVSVTSMNERSVGLGNRRGTETRGTFPVLALKGVRLDAAVRFQLWAATPVEVETAMADLNARLLADRDTLWIAGVLRLALEASAPADFISPLNAWRRTSDYRVLYEFHYQDTDGAESLIARIPIQSDLEVRDSPERETTVVTDEMVRWDNEAAPPVVIRGPFNAGSLSVLAFLTGTAPTGTVTVKRTFDGAVGAPTSHPTLADFLAGVAGPNAPERHAQISFASLADFLAAFAEEPALIDAEEHLGSEPAPMTLRRKPVVKSARNRIGLHVDATGVTHFLKILYDGDPSPGAGEVKVDRATGQMTFGDAVATADKVIASYVTAAGDPVALGDWNLDNVPDSYAAKVLAIQPAVHLASAADRLEIAYQNAMFDQVGVVYLRARRG